MMEVLGKAILAIDNKNSARVIRDGTVAAWRLKLHDAQIYCVAVSNENTFATGGEDKICRVWNSKLELLYEHSRHSQTITSICCITN
jgi:WD40 repeat protein